MIEALGEAALRTLLLATIVQLGLWLLRVKRPKLRLITWTVVLAASLTMPVLQWTTPLRLSVLPDLSGPALTEAAGPQQHAFAFEASTPAQAAEVTGPSTVVPWLEILYLLVVGILLLRLAVGIVLSLRLARRAEPTRADWAANMDIRISRDIVAPVTVGSVILLPWDSVIWPVAVREAVLVHEHAHVKRRDFAMLVASQVNRAVFWFSPLSWWLHRQLAILAELASDDQAMELIGDCTGYAKVLLAMGRRSGPLLRGLAMARPATLAYRIDRILSDRVATNPVSPIYQVVLVVGAASLSIVAAGSRSNPALSLMMIPAARPTSPLISADSSAALVASEEAVRSTFVPVPAPQIEVASSAPFRPVPVVRAAASPSSPASRKAVQPIAHLASRNTFTVPPPQRTRVERDRSAYDASRVAGGVVIAGLAPRGNEGHVTANSAGLDSRASPADQVGLASSAPPLQRRTDEQSCVGVYLPDPGAGRLDGAVDFVRAKRLRGADGTPWLKLFLGARTRARLGGLDVERDAIRTTVVTALPRDMTHVSGMTHGTYGTIAFECGGPDA